MIITIQPWSVYLGFIILGLFAGIGNQIGQHFMKNYVMRKYNKLKKMMFNKDEKIKKVLQ